MPKLTIRGTRFISGADAMFPRVAMGLRTSSLRNGSEDPSVRCDRSGRTVIDRFAALGTAPVPAAMATPAALDERFKSELAGWSKLLAGANPQ